MPTDQPSSADKRQQRLLAERHARVAENLPAFRELLQVVEWTRAEIDVAPDVAAEQEAFYRQQPAFQKLALTLGFDPRPSAFSDWLEWGAARMLTEDQPAQWRHVVARVNRASRLAILAEAEQAGVGVWRCLEATDRSMAALTVEAVTALSLDEPRPPPSEAPEWLPILGPGEPGSDDARRIRYLSEVELRTLILLRRQQHGVDAAEETATPQDPETSRQLKAAATVQLGKAAGRHFVRWLEGEPNANEYWVKLTVTPYSHNQLEMPVAAWLPEVIDLPGATELAQIVPAEPVIELTGESINWLKEGLPPAGSRAPRTPLTRHTSAATLSAAVARDAAESDREFLLLHDLLRQDVDWLWRGVARRRRARGEATPRPPQRVPSELAEPGTLLSRREARQYWYKLAGGAGARLDTATLDEVWEKSAAAYPWWWTCSGCGSWWLHGCADCRAVRDACRVATACPKCHEPLNYPQSERNVLFDGDTDFIRDGIRKFRDAQRNSPPRR